jgi:hypothetical protein
LKINTKAAGQGLLAICKIKPYLTKCQATRGKRQAASQAKGKAGSQQKKS